MKQFAKLLLIFAYLCLLLSGCSQSSTGTTTSSASYANIDFKDGQYYAVAYLGYENMDSLTAYSQKYLGGAAVPVLQISGGEYYLVIPRYEGMGLEIYANELEPQQSTLFYGSENATPFVLQCNISDIFPNSTIRFSYEGTDVEFSPYQSLMDGSLQIGPQGVDITTYG